MAAAQGVFPKTGNDPIYFSEINDFHNPIKQVYTGSGFDSTQVGAGSDEQSHELDAVTDVSGRNYAVITAVGTSSSLFNGAAWQARAELKYQIKEIGGSYADIIAYKDMLDTGGAGGIDSIEIVTTYKIVAELTSGMKTNGFQIKVFSKSTSTADGSGSFTNIQTTQELS